MNKFLLIKRGQYWKSDSQGYTSLKSNAGRYNKKEAEKRCHSDGIPVTMISEEDAPELSENHTLSDIDTLTYKKNTEIKSLKDQIEELRVQNMRLEEALTFYGKGKNYKFSSELLPPVQEDKGKIATRALKTNQTYSDQYEKDMDQRMSAAGMIPLSEILKKKSHMDYWMAHKGVVDYESFEAYLKTKHKSFMRQRIPYELGEKPQGELYEWIFSHSAVLQDILSNWRVMKDRMNNEIHPDWRPMDTTKKDRTPILALIRHDLVKYTGREDLDRWAGLQVPIRHTGIAEDGYDFGWSVALPVGHGLGADDWFIGWKPL